MHSPYTRSTDLVPSDEYLLKSMATDFHGEKSESREACKIRLSQFTTSNCRNEGFYECNIRKLL